MKGGVQCCLWFVTFTFIQVWSVPHSERRWVTYLLQDYNRSLRPVRSATDPVTVSVQMILLDILSLEENNNRVTLRVWMNLRWIDEFLVWNPGKYGGVERLNFAATGSNVKIWTPDITVLNSLKMEFGRDSDAVVHSNGTVAWVQAFTITVPMSYEFRGNAWTGILKVASWSYDETLVRLEPLHPTDVRMEMGITALSDQWAVLSNNGHTEVMQGVPCCRLPYPSVVYVLRLRKKIGSSLMGRRSFPLRRNP